MLYNGEAGMPSDKMTLNLADSYMDSGEIYLDLQVRVLNINKGRNPEMAQRSPTLNGYETFTAKVREYMKPGNTTLEQAIDRATEECISEGLLVKYLKLYRTEVRNMWATEWKMDKRRPHTNDGADRLTAPPPDNRPQRTGGTRG